jgi:hypothetical protein
MKFFAGTLFAIGSLLAIHSFGIEAGLAIAMMLLGIRYS